MIDDRDPAGGRPEHTSTENLNLPLLNVLQVGTCQVTPQVAQLFANRNGVEPGDVVDAGSLIVRHF
jgi:hypothetical protein